MPCNAIHRLGYTRTRQSINLGDPAILNAHNAVRAGQAGWVVYSLSSSNELKVQEQGDSDAGLEELQDEFSDGR